MNILALEAATESCSVALLRGERIYRRSQVAPREHAVLLLPMVQALLDEAGVQKRELNAISFGRGPGSFTGVRIATGVAQGLAYALDLPVLPISTLAALAQGAWREQGARKVAAAIDARMGEVYWGGYELQDTVMRLAGDEGVYPPEQVPVPERAADCFGYGSGWQTYAETLEKRSGIARHLGERFPQAEDLLPLALADWHAGKAIAAAQAQPVYLRDRVTHQRKS